MLAKKLLLLLSIAAYQVHGSELSTEHQAWVSELSEKYELSEQEIKDAINQANINQSVLTKIQTPWESKPWYKYAPIFITDTRINKGVEYWQQHEASFARAEQEYGVPAHIIVAIMGVETFYGKYKGNIPVLDSLYTLGFNYPRRGAFFRQEFAEYIKLSQQQDWQITDVKGSYAGAMGLGQFISSSYSHYGVDFSGDDHIDMINNPADAIGSIANYFSAHKWQTDGSVAYRAQLSNEQAAALVSDKLTINSTWGELAAAGITLELSPEQLISRGINADTPANLLQLQQLDSNEYWVYFNNFYTITRYNHSALYAMAVFQLSEQIKQAKEAQQ